MGLRVYNSERYTVDLDALLVKANIESTLVRTREKAESDLDDGVWFKFEDQVDLATQGEYGGVRQVYRAGIGEVLKNLNLAKCVLLTVVRQEIKILRKELKFSVRIHSSSDSLTSLEFLNSAFLSVREVVSGFSPDFFC